MVQLKRETKIKYLIFLTSFNDLVCAVCHKDQCADATKLTHFYSRVGGGLATYVKFATLEILEGWLTQRAVCVFCTVVGLSNQL